MKEQFIQKMVDDIKESLKDRLTTKRETCSQAPVYGWSVEEYMYMPHVAERLIADGFSVSSSVNHGVTDWLIAQ